MKYSRSAAGTRSFAFLLLASVLLTGCNESWLEEDKKRVDELSVLFAKAIAPEIDWVDKDATRSTCEQGVFLSSYQATIDYALRAEVLGHDIDVDRHLTAARNWLPGNGWTITKDYKTDTGSKRLVAVNRDVEVDFSIGGYEKSFGIFVAGPCRTIVNWPE